VRPRCVSRWEAIPYSRRPENPAAASFPLLILSTPPPPTPIIPQTRFAQEDFSLLPPLRGGDGAGWDFMNRQSGGPKAFTGSSAFIGEYQPPEPLARPKPAAAPVAAAAPAAAAPAAAAAKCVLFSPAGLTPARPPAPLPALPLASRPTTTHKPTANQPPTNHLPTRPAGPGKPLGPDDVDAKTKSLFREFASVGDFSEAATCVRELRDAPKAAGVTDLSGLTKAALEEVFDATEAKPQAALLGLLVRLAGEKLVTAAELRAGVEGYTEQLEDIRWVCFSSRRLCRAGALGWR
jgi:hypothetical protein